MKRIQIMVVTALVASLLLIATPALAQEGDGYELSWWSLTGGGGNSEDDAQEYSLTGVIGQVATESLADGDFTVTGGIFTNESAKASSSGGAFDVFLPIILRD